MIYFAFDRVLWLAKGCLISDSTPHQLLSSLEKLHLACPPGEVVSNHMMDLLENDEHRQIMIENSSTMIFSGDVKMYAIPDYFIIPLESMRAPRSATY